MLYALLGMSPMNMERKQPDEAMCTMISCLPAELLSHIFSFLDGVAPSDQRLHDQPHANILRDPQSQTLKNISLVSRQWRATVLPLVFRNVVWYLDRFELMQADHLQHAPSAIPLLHFIREHSLASYVKSLTLVISCTPTTGNGDVGLYRRGDGSGHYGYSPDPLQPPSPLRRGAGAERDLIFNEDSNWLWNLLFGVVNPLRFTLVASPRMLASLLARMLFLGDEWSFNQSHHILSLSRHSQNRASTAVVTVREVADTDANAVEVDTLSFAATPTPAPAPAPAPRPSSSSSSSFARPSRTPCALFTVRPWTSLLLNEGSSTRVYKTYEYFHKRPPSLLGALLGAESFPNDAALIPPTVRSLSYVGIFPLSSHVNTLVQFLPRIERLFIQLVPRNDILKDRREMDHLDMDDLWAERNMSYGRIMPKLFDSSNAAGNWRFLGEFESGDAADRESWDIAVDYVAANTAEWRVDREGVFVKRRGPGELK